MTPNHRYSFGKVAIFIAQLYTYLWHIPLLKTDPKTHNLYLLLPIYRIVLPLSQSAWISAFNVKPYPLFFLLADDNMLSESASICWIGALSILISNWC